MMTEIIKKLINLLGDKKVKFSQDYLEKYGIDWYKEIKPDPTAIVFPHNENDLQAIVLFAEKEDQKLVISGGRTGLCGGATAANKEIVVSLEKMNDMNWVSEKDQVICQAGAITDSVKKGYCNVFTWLTYTMLTYLCCVPHTYPYLTISLKEVIR